MKTANELLREKREKASGESLNEAKYIVRDIPSDPNWGTLGEGQWEVVVGGEVLGTVSQDPKSGKFQGSLRGSLKKLPKRPSKEQAAKDVYAEFQSAVKEAKKLAKSLDPAYRKMRSGLPPQKQDAVLKSIQNLYDVLDSLES